MTSLPFKAGHWCRPCWLEATSAWADGGSASARASVKYARMVFIFVEVVGSGRLVMSMTFRPLAAPGALSLRRGQGDIQQQAAVSATNESLHRAAGLFQCRGVAAAVTQGGQIRRRILMLRQ